VYDKWADANKLQNLIKRKSDLVLEKATRESTKQSLLYKFSQNTFFDMSTLFDKLENNEINEFMFHFASSINVRNEQIQELTKCLANMSTSIEKLGMFSLWLF
jgi:predicted transcriptional regulator